MLDNQWREEKAADSSQKSVYVLEPKPAAVDHERALYVATLDLNFSPLMQFARAVTHHGFNYWQKEYKKVQMVPPTRGEPTPEKGQLQFLSRADGSGYAFYALFASLSRHQWRILMEDGLLHLPWAAMNPVQRQNALATQHREQRLSRFSETYLTPEENRAVEQQERASIQRFGIVLSVDKNPVNGRIVGCSSGPVGSARGSLRVSEEGTQFLLPVCGNPYLFDTETSSPVTADSANVSAGKPPSAAGSSAEPADETALQSAAFPAGISFTQTDTWADVVQTLAEKLPFAVVSDAYAAARYCLYPPLKNGAAVTGNLDKMTVAQALNTLCAAYQYLWWYEKPDNKDALGTLFFRSRTYFVEKRYEPPLATVKKATAALAFGANRVISVPLVDSMTDLTVEQIQGIAGWAFKSRGWDNYGLARVPLLDFMKGGGAADAAFRGLRFWSRLSVEQKQRMVSKEGLPVDLVSDVLQKELGQMVSPSSMEKPPVKSAAPSDTPRLRVSYTESLDEHFLPDYAPKWGAKELRPALLTLDWQVEESSIRSLLPLPVALTPPPQPKKKQTEATPKV